MKNMQNLLIQEEEKLPKTGQTVLIRAAKENTPLRMFHIMMPLHTVIDYQKMTVPQITDFRQKGNGNRRQGTCQKMQILMQVKTKV